MTEASFHEPRKPVDAEQKDVVEQNRFSGFNRLEKLLSTEHLDANGMRPSVVLPNIDSDAIEGHSVQCIKDVQTKQLTVSFKLTQPMHAHALEQLAMKMQPGSDLSVTDGAIEYLSAEPAAGVQVKAADAVYVRLNSFDVTIAQQPANDKVARASLGLVRITLPPEMNNASPNNIAESLNIIADQLFAISDLFVDTSTEGHQAYLESLLSWHDGEDTTFSNAEASKADVCGGYEAWVQPDRAAAYAKEFGHMAIYHQVSWAGNIVKMIRANGLISTSNRFARGSINSGICSMTDLDTGGADQAFTRTITESSKDENSKNTLLESGKVYILFKPELFNRLDWYIYPENRFGSTHPDEFHDRYTPRDFLKTMSERKFAAFQENEQMFRHGIGLEYFAKLIVADEQTRTSLIAQLQEEGITEVNGETLEDFIQVGQGGTIEDFLAHAPKVQGT